VVIHGACRLALTSRFGAGAAPALALDRALQARDLGRAGAAHEWKTTDNGGERRSVDRPGQ
jgi:hypothetical protein